MAQVGSRIGSIRLTSVLGRGGMGEVYEGFDDTLQRAVAVKSIRGDFAVAREAKARFLHEARTLSRLHHPNICLVHDFLEHDGEAFLVMELIEGSLLGEAIARGLGRHLKLEVAIQVADVLIVAHARGIVHRDLKPDNLMLTPEHVVKVLDFGIARSDDAPPDSPARDGKARADGEHAATIAAIDTFATTRRPIPGSPPRTRAGTLIGTPAYMSPEQARGEEVSPASDMYAFGLVLQYLFTEAPPFDADIGVAELLERAKCGESPAVEGVPRDLAALIRALKSVAPEERPTASETAARLRKTRSRPRRRRRTAAAAALLVAAAGFGAKHTLDLGHEREQALAARDEAEEARAEAQTAREQAEAVNEFLVDVLASADPGEARGREVTVREVLDRAAAELPLRDDLEPSAKVRFLTLTGDVYANLGLMDKARSTLEAAVEIAGREPELEAGTHSKSLSSLGRIEELQGDLAEARHNYEQAREILVRRMPDDLHGQASILMSIGNVESLEGDLDAARASYEEALEIVLEVKGPDHPHTAMVYGNLAKIAEDGRDCPRSIELNLKALRIFETELGADHPYVAVANNNLATCYESEGRLEEAVDAHLRSLKVREAVLGPDHPDTGQSLLNLAAVRIAQGELEEAERLLDRGTAITLAAFGPSHSHVVSAQLVAVELAQAQGQLAAAERIAREAVSTAETLDGAQEEAFVTSEYLVGVLLARGKAREALQVAEAALEDHQTALGPQHAWVAAIWVEVARARFAVGDTAGARSALVAARQGDASLDEIEEPPALVQMAREVAAQNPSPAPSPGRE